MIQFLNKKKIFYIIVFCSLIFSVAWFCFVRPTKIARAGVGDNVSGFAWSKNIGWISFNNTSGGGGSSYGVNIADSGSIGVFSGYAWADNGGWLSFNEADLAGCPAAPCRATVEKQTGAVLGWAKFLTTNDWVRLSGGNSSVAIDRITKTFSGWAWAGETAGWISFNCSQTQTGNICPSANYKVSTSFNLNTKPTANISASPNPLAVNLCSVPGYNFSWFFFDADNGDTQSSYQLQIDKQGDFAQFDLGEIDTTVNRTAQNNEIQTKEILLANNPGPDQLAYNSTYHWRLRVWDNWNNVSSWAYGSDFATPSNVLPSPDFTFKPQIIVKGQLIRFCATYEPGVCDSNASICYGSGAPLCSGAKFTWTPPANAEFASSTSVNSENPVIKFLSSGKDQVVKLEIQDLAGACSVQKNVSVALPLPKWQEIPGQ